MAQPENNPGTEKGKIHWRVVGMLAFILIILPAGSWYYLTQGYNYRKDLLDDLKEEFGEVKPYTLQTADGESYGTEDFAGNTAVVNFIGSRDLQREFVWTNLTKLHEQFDDRNDILFITHVAGDPLANLPKDTAQWKIITGTEAQLSKIAAENYNLKFPAEQNILDNSQIILLDSSRIRNYYDANDPMQMGRLLEHITIVMPRQAERDIILERNKEM